MLPSVHVTMKQHVAKNMSNDNPTTTTVAVNGTSNSNNSNNSIAVSDMKDGELLKEVLELVMKEKLVTGMDSQANVVHFKQPLQLQEILDLSVCNEESSVQEAKGILRQVLDYSVKTQHPHFYNQLYGGIDEVALTGAWITEALNTNQNIFGGDIDYGEFEHYENYEGCADEENIDDSENEQISKSLMENRKYLSKENDKREELEVEEGNDEVEEASYEDDENGWWKENVYVRGGSGVHYGGTQGGSISNMYGMVLARYHHRPLIKRTGIFTQNPLVAFTSDQGHYSVSKSAAWLGLGMDNVIAVPSDEQGRMLPKALKEAVQEARNKGHTPFFVNATSGTTVLGTYDPLEELADVCQEERLWLHVDGLLHECNSYLATYLFQQDKYYDVSYDTGDKSIQCGRKVDAFKLWFYLKVHGMGQLRSRVDLAFEASRYLARQVVLREGFRLVQQPECTNVCFWYIPPSMRGQPETSEWWGRIAKVAPEIKARMVKEGTMMIGYQPLACKNLVNFFRMVTTCTPVPTSTHMDQVLDTIDALGTDL
ncbi:hypothetical protein Pmani_013739 [Petrolisthes manimaculis]|uniref:Glutamate decarboxylase n=1 Tax=Petrolisthes manimaculis TaxID=1843537 RepID=A0AAE1PUA4_9EUCA|nr:hypothetical protein Pmani_013739 [Petrolisthes manimaculis]